MFPFSSFSFFSFLLLLVVEPGKTAAKPPPILNSARKHFLAQIDPDTVLANGKVVIAKIDKHTSSLSTQTAARPHTTTGAFYNPTASEKTSKKESISSQLSSTIPERPGTSSGMSIFPLFAPTYLLALSLRSPPLPPLFFSHVYL